MIITIKIYSNKQGSKHSASRRVPSRVWREAHESFERSADRRVGRR